ncbi:MAG: hypothetical protein SFV32_04825 [Opitutaceae bacterium]|nr:hypothetical protein [Opitutaceae bacterium]
MLHLSRRNLATPNLLFLSLELTHAGNFVALVTSRLPMKENSC